MQIPNLWGSEQPVWARNFVAVDLANFTVGRFALTAPVCFTRGTVVLTFAEAASMVAPAEPCVWSALLGVPLS